MFVFTPSQRRIVSLSLVMLALPAFFMLAGCSRFNRATQSMAGALTMYKPEVVQGNFISSEQVQALRPGMTRVQVRDTLGTPLTTSIFHADRWDYVFTMKRVRVEPQKYRLTVFFKGDELDRYEGDEMPSETEFVNRISTAKPGKLPRLEATEEELARYSASGSSASADAEENRPAPATTTSYPPLEP